MLPDWVLNPGPLTYESSALPIALQGPAMQARMLIFSMQVDDDLLYHDIENQPSSANSFLYLSNFLFFHTLKNEIFVKDFSTTMQARMFIFDIQVVDTCCIVGLRTNLLLIFICICPIFFPSIL